MKEDTRRFTRWVELTDFISVEQAWWFWVHCYVCLQYVLLFYISKVVFIVTVFIIMMASYFKVVHSLHFLYQHTPLLYQLNAHYKLVKH